MHPVAKFAGTHMLLTQECADTCVRHTTLTQFPVEGGIDSTTEATPPPRCCFESAEGEGVREEAGKSGPKSEA